MGRKWSARLWGIAAGLAAASASWVTSADQRPTAPRRPVAAAFLDGGRLVCVANSRTGTVSLLDLNEGRVRGEWPVGRRLADLAVTPDRRHVLAVDPDAHELIALRFDGAAFTVRARLAVGPYPASVAVTPDGRRATVASTWSRRVEVVDLTSTAPRVIHTVRLPFAPCNQCVLPGSTRVAVADTFGGGVAVVDAEAGRLVAVRELSGHNLRGLAITPDGRELLIAHQVLDQKLPATRENVERGRLMANVVRRVPLDGLLDPRSDLETISRVIRLDGAGDPAGVIPLGGDRSAVALAGVNELALTGAGAKRVVVGRRPTAVAASGEILLVVNTSDDSVSVIDARRGSVTATIPLGPPARPGPKDRGELLFHDARLSAGASMSCHSCHTDGHTNGLLADTLGDGSHGTPKRTLTLMGTALTDPWGWDGSMKYLHDQVEHSLQTTMYDPGPIGGHVPDLVSFLHGLPPPPPAEPEADDPAVGRGRELFRHHGCVRCHIPPLTYSSHGALDVGFADEEGRAKFNPPSLRGVGQGYRFLHDGRAATLAEVFTKCGHQLDADTDPAELADLLRFLRSL